LETRWLHALPREKAVDRVPMNAQHAADADRIEPAVVDQAPDRLGVHAELFRHLANTDEPWISAC
jgi:phage gp46-like protein